MHLHEPMTFFTDLLLSGLCFFFSCRLNRPGVSLWRYCFGLSGAGALFGGLHHGFSALPFNLPHHLWTATLVSLSLAGLFLWLAACRSLCPGKPMQILASLGFLKTGFLSTLALMERTFLLVITDYGLSMVLFALLALYGARRHKNPKPGTWPFLFVVLSVLAAAIQQSGLPSWPHFNHNDLYHLVQMAAMYALYRGVLGWHPAAAGRAENPQAG